MRHLYECPLRWADMDLLGHVNNVTYVDYLQEARIDMLTLHAPMRGGEELAEGVVVVRHEVDFARPLVFRTRPVRIEVWVTRIRAASFTMAYEVFDEDGEDGRTVYLRATSVLAPYVFAGERPRRITAGEREVLERFLEQPAPRREGVPGEPGGSGHEMDLKVRWSDVDAYAHVNNVKYFEYLQEARIRYFMDLQRDAEQPWSAHVVARTDVDYLRPILFRLQPYTVRSAITRVGRSSFTVASQVLDGSAVLARGEVVMVSFDTEAGAAAAMPEAQRERLLAEVRDPEAPGC